MNSNDDDISLLRERLRICEEDFNKEEREKLMAERRETNLHEALKKSQLEMTWYKSVYETEKREKERLIEHFQQVFPSAVTGGFEVSPAPQIQVLCVFSCFFEFLLLFSRTHRF